MKEQTNNPTNNPTCKGNVSKPMPYKKNNTALDVHIPAALVTEQKRKSKKQKRKRKEKKSKAKQSKAKQSKAKQSKAKQSKAKQSKAKKTRLRLLTSILREAKCYIGLPRSISHTLKAPSAVTR